MFATSRINKLFGGLQLECHHQRTPKRFQPFKKAAFNSDSGEIPLQIGPANTSHHFPPATRTFDSSSAFIPSSATPVRVPGRCSRRDPSGQAGEALLGAPTPGTQVAKTRAVAGSSLDGMGPSKTTHFETAKGRPCLGCVSPISNGKWLEMLKVCSCVFYER